jgi:hypothetical protein
MPDAESGRVDLIVMRGVANLAIVDVGILGIVTHRALLVLKPSIDLLPGAYNTRFGMQ